MSVGPGEFCFCFGIESGLLFSIQEKAGETSGLLTKFDPPKKKKKSLVIYDETRVSHMNGASSDQYFIFTNTLCHKYTVATDLRVIFEMASVCRILDSFDAV